MLGLHPYDMAVVAAYLVGIVAVGVYVARRVKDTGHYFLGGRQFGKLLMIAQSFGVGTQAEHPVGTAGKSYALGLSGIWYTWKFIFCTPFYWVIAPIFRRLRYVTSAEYMEARYGPGMAVVYTIFALLFFMMNLSGMLNGMSKVVSNATGGAVSHWEVLIWGTTIFVVYSFFGGLIAAAVTDFVQGFFIIALSFMLLPAGFSALGGYRAFQQTLVGDRSDFFSLATPGEITIGVIILLSVQSIFSIFAQPHIMASVGTGKTESNCRIGFTYGSMVKRVCTLGWALAGMIVAAMVVQGLIDGPELTSLQHDAENAFGLACRQLLGPGFLGLMIACILAAGMSTSSAFMVDSGALFVQNIYRRYLRPSEGDRHYLWAGRFSGLAITVAAVSLTFLMTQVIDAILNSDTLAAFMGVPFVLGFFWKRANRWGAALAFFVPTVLFFVLNWWLHPQPPGVAADPEWIKWHADSFVYSLGCCIVLMIAGSLLTRPESDRSWEALQERLHTPVSVEDVPEAERPGRAREAEASGEGLLLVDALELHRQFSFRRYRSDITGFVVASGIVLGMIACAWLIGGI